VTFVIVEHEVLTSSAWPRRKQRRQVSWTGRATVLGQGRKAWIVPRLQVIAATVADGLPSKVAIMLPDGQCAIYERVQGQASDSAQ
jgi:hypothetical protein